MLGLVGQAQAKVSKTALNSFDMTDYAPSLVVLLGETALKQVQVSVAGSLGMLRSYGSPARVIVVYLQNSDPR